MIETNVSTSASLSEAGRRAWVIFACTFAPGRSTPRVAVWRRLQRSGAVALKAGLYVLPATPECVETIQWLAQEARAEGADPIVIRAEIIEGLSDPEIIELFHEARREDYAALEARLHEIGRAVALPGAGLTDSRADLERVRADYQQLRRIDYFDAPSGQLVGARVDALASTLAASSLPEPDVPAVARDDYVGRTWVTRPQPFVDRLACAWLIRRFIDPAATIRYAGAAAPGEVAFDMEPGTFSHLGNRCTFEVMVEAFGLRAPGVDALGEIVHEIDLHDGRYARPEVAGLESVLHGWRESDRSDAALEAAGMELFDGVYRSLQQ